MSANTPASSPVSIFSVGYLFGFLTRLLRRNGVSVGDAAPIDEKSDLRIRKEYTDNPELLSVQQQVWTLATHTLVSTEARKTRNRVIRSLHHIAENRPISKKNEQTPLVAGRYCPHREDVIKTLLEPRRLKKLPEEHPNRISALTDAYFNLLSLCLYPASFLSASETLDRPFFNFCPLYGETRAQSDNIRQFDGRGMLRPDTFADNERAARLQPAVSALLIVWNRNHNYIAHSLFIRFSGIKKWQNSAYFSQNLGHSSVMKVQDSEIFEAAMRINCTQFRNSICEDVLKGLFGLSDFEPSAELDVLADISDRPKGPSKKGPEILTHIETFFLYPLNPLMSKLDGQIIEGVFKNRAQDDLLVLTHSDCPRSARFPSVYRRSANVLVPLVRDTKTALYDDKDIASIIMEAREQPAGPPGSGSSTPIYSQSADADALEREETWKMCTFNEFRKMYGLQPLSSFTAWNPDPEVSTAAEKLYENIDNLGLYVGLQCEASVHGRANRFGRTAGSGLGFGFTKTYAMLVDLVTRIRSEPHYNLEKSIMRQTMGSEDPLRQWILKETGMRWESRISGAIFPRILQRILPHQFPFNHTYSHFLFSTPLEKDDPNLKRYTKDYLTAEKPHLPQIHALENVATFKEVFEDEERYNTVYKDQLDILTGRYGYFLGMDKKDLHRTDRLMTMFALIPDRRGSLKRYGYYFGRLTADYIRKNSKQLEDGSYSVDIIADVINNVCTRWVCETLFDYALMEDERSSIVSQSGANMKTTKEMYQEFANLSTFIFKISSHDDPYEAQCRAIESSQYLRDHIKQKIPEPDWLQKNLSYTERLRSLVQFSIQSFKEMVGLWFRGKRLPSRTAQTFLRRVVQANRLIRLPKNDLVSLMHDKIKTIKYTEKRFSADTVDRAERDIEVSRVVANILGLAAVTAVNLPQVCSLVVDYYLRPENEKEREIIQGHVDDLDGIDSIYNPSPRFSAAKDNLNGMLVPFIHKAMRNSLPLALWRRCTKKSTLKLSSEDETIIHERDLIFADFKFLREQTNDASHLLGIGMHKCPALTKDYSKSFIDHVIPEVIRAIFRLQGLRVQGFSESGLQGVDPRPSPYNSPMDHKIYVSNRGDVSFYPQTLLLQYDSLPASELDDSVDAGDQVFKFSISRMVIRTTEYFLGFMTALWALYKATVVVLTCSGFILLIFGLGPRARRPAYIPKMSEVQNLYVDCPQPLMAWDDWTTRTLSPGADGIPVDIAYNSSVPIAHQLQIYDADKKDTKVAIYVDEILRGLTTDFELDKEIDCGDQAYQCYAQQFSFGSIIVPSGSHSVRISWAGKELTNGTYPNLGKIKSRRILMKRDYCAA